MVGNMPPTDRARIKKLGWNKTAMCEEWIDEIDDFLMTHVTERDRTELEQSNASRILAERRREGWGSF